MMWRCVSLGQLFILTLAACGGPAAPAAAGEAPARGDPWSQPAPPPERKVDAGATASYAATFAAAEALFKHHEVFLKKWARSGPAAWRVLALAKIGQAHWQRSCGVKAVHGVCLRPGRRGPGRAGCGSPPRMVRRRKAQVTRAKSYLTRALALHRSLGSRPPGRADPARQRLRAAMELAAEWAALTEADAQHEQLLGLRLPRARASLERRMIAVGQQLVAARAAYRQLFKTSQGEPGLAALSRLVQLQRALARALCTAGHPRAQAEQQKAEAAARLCQDRAKELKLQASPWAKACAS